MIFNKVSNKIKMRFYDLGVKNSQILTWLFFLDRKTWISNFIRNYLSNLFKLF